MNSFLFPEAGRRRAGLALLPLAVALTAVLGLGACSRNDVKPAAAPVEVGVVTVHAADAALATELAGRAKTRTSAAIVPQVGGIIRQRHFEEGAQVKAGQLLYEIDPAPYQAALASAQAALTKAQATARAAELTAKRQVALAKIDAVSQQDADDAQAALAQDQAAVAVAQADVQTARINLGYTRIVSPIAGRIDVSAVSQGALVTANQSTALTTVRQLDPLVVDVTQSSADVLKLRQALANGSLGASADGQVPVRIVLEDGSTYAHAGELQFSGVSVDESTGTITLRASVPNPEGLLMPGMYLRAVLDQGVLRGALLVPQQAVTRTPNGGATALVITREGVVEQRTLALGRAVGNQWQVTQGLAAGDRVVAQGLQKVRKGDKVSAVEIDPKTGRAADSAAPAAAAAAATAAPATSATPAAR
ncbi:MAG: Multidrug export protein AcrE [Paracidovorax wautersii]|uniref:Multidrug export protein AcrE n=1 Tax=Paracidovorax wautersii TaxID=1177982 RepID=A0A7V8JPX5_9BURK|nr:MAG: Multidrug export protein AcrE [Paracidovorax wautersii]